MSTQSLLITNLIISVGALILAVLALYLTRKNDKLRKNFYSGKEEVSIEQILSAQAVQLRSLMEDQNKLLEELQRLTFNSNFAVQKVGLVRFNSLGGSAGNLSFSAALLDGDNTGFVVTSMFGREQNRIYAKPIIKGESEFTLTQEEQKAINTALKEWKNKTAPVIKSNRQRKSRSQLM